MMTRGFRIFLMLEWGISTIRHTNAKYFAENWNRCVKKNYVWKRKAHSTNHIIINIYAIFIVARSAHANIFFLVGNNEIFVSGDDQRIPECCRMGQPAASGIVNGLIEFVLCIGTTAVPMHQASRIQTHSETCEEIIIVIQLTHVSISCFYSFSR